MMGKILSVIIIIYCATASAQIRLYRQLPELPLSPHYKVEVKQGNGQYKEVFTYQIPQNSTGHITKNDQFASFGFDPAGGPAEIRISRKDKLALSADNARLMNQTIEGTSSRIESGSLVISCQSAKKHLYVSMVGKTEYPLMIFADPYLDKPIPAEANVVTFHARNTPYLQTARYDRYTVPNHVDVVVIEDGALIKGTVHIANGRKKPLTIQGRGMILGNGNAVHGHNSNYYDAVVLNNGAKYHIENIMVVNSRHSALNIGAEAVIDNIKMYGYAAVNKGISASKKAIIANVFSKINNHHVEICHNDILIENCTYWGQKNGALFQLAQKSTNPGSNSLIQKCEVLAWEATSGDPKLKQGGTARTLISLKFTDSIKYTGNHIFRDIYVHGQIDRFIGINAKYQGAKPVNMSNTHFENITFEKKPLKYSWIYTNNSPYIVELSFKNVKMSGHCISASNYPFKTEGNVVLNYLGCNSYGKVPHNMAGKANPKPETQRNDIESCSQTNGNIDTKRHETYISNKIIRFVSSFITEAAAFASIKYKSIKAPANTSNCASLQGKDGISGIECTKQAGTAVESSELAAQGNAQPNKIYVSTECSFRLALSNALDKAASFVAIMQTYIGIYIEEPANLYRDIRQYFAGGGECQQQTLSCAKACNSIDNQVN
jgi:hypothetical protein